MTDWGRIHTLYALLVRHYPSVGAAVGYAASWGRVGDASQGLQVLEELGAEGPQRSQPYWAVRAWLLGELGRAKESHAAYERAIGLCADPAVRAWLRGRQKALVG